MNFNKVEVKKVTIVNGEYFCDIDISVEEWGMILQDETVTTENYKSALLKFYKETDHKSTCKALGIKYDTTPQSISGIITNFAKAVQKKLNRFEVIGTDGTSSYWIIPMTGKNIGEYFEWTLRPELVEAIKNLKIKEMHYLQKLYNDALLNEHWVFFDWFPFYKSCVTEYKEQAVSNKWTDVVFQRLVKDTTDNGISDLRQGNFTWEEFEKIKNAWHSIQPVFKKVAENNEISVFEFKEIVNFFGKQTNGNRPSGTNRVVAAFLPNVVTTVVNYKYLRYTIEKLQTKCLDYPEIQNDWLLDNFSFINYCNANITFIDPWHSSLFAWYLKEFFENEILNNLQELEVMEQYSELLENNYNIILTGAPGTGKTYLAKQIALKMLFGKNSEDLLSHAENELLKKHFCFMQFHPSYDYTDFVEGLRPTQPDDNGNIGFELKNGIFKEFCKCALKKNSVYITDNFDEKYELFINDLSELELEFETVTHKKKFKVEINSNKSCVAIPLTDVGTRMSMTKEMIRDYVIKGKIRNWKSYITIIGNYFKENYSVNVITWEEEDLPYIFVIDEINRGEISKIFGELFFSIDPGYRGISGKVQTQYANIQSDETIFDEDLGQGWFYVPENVYIIGTMNDIDRSVESMDFAMRRRFAWKEIKAEDRISMWDGEINDWKEEAKNRMLSLNKAIEKIPGLSEAYHIGPAYFLKLRNYIDTQKPFESLWENHLHGVLFEYLRGMPDVKSKLGELKKSYNQEI